MDAMLNGPQGRILLGSVTLTMGRAQDNQLVIHDAKVSAHHAEIHLEKHGHSIIDLESTNGTFLNEQRLEPNRPYRLQPLDMIRLGGATFTYEVGKAAVDASSLHASPPVDWNPGYQTTITAPFTPIPAVNVEIMRDQQAYQQPAAPAHAPSQRPVYTPPPGLLKILVARPQKNRQGRGVTLAVTCGIVLFGVIGFALLAFVVFDVLSGPSSVVVSTPDMTLKIYCDALNRRDYPTAYSQFSTGFKSTLSEPEFAHRFSAAGITGCQASAIQRDGPIATSIITYADNKGNTIIFNAYLINDNGVWKIDTQQT